LGIGSGIAYMAPLKNLWKYFPNRKGLVSGLVVCGFGSSALIFNTIADKYINPDRLLPEEIGSNKYYPESVANNYPSCMLLFTAIFSVFSTIGFLLTINYKTDQVSNEASIESHNASSITLDENQQPETLFKILTRLKFISLIIIASGTMFFNFLLINTSKLISTNIHMEESLTTSMNLFFALFNGFGRPAWGYLFDYTTFRYIFMGVNIAQVCIAIILLFYRSQVMIFYFLYLIVGLCTAANFAVFPPNITRLYGIKKASKVYGVVFIFFGIISFSTAVAAKFIIKTDNDMNIIFIMSAVFSSLSLIVLYGFKETPYVKKSKNQLLNS